MIRQFKAFHPLVIFCYYLGSIALIMLFMHPVFLLISVSSFVMIHILEDRCKTLLPWLFFILSTGILIFIINPFFNERGRHILFEIVGHRVTLEATIYGGMSALSIVGVMLVFVAYNEVMTPNKLLFLFSKFLPQFAVLLMLTLRFIPLMKRRLEEISAIQTSKGISVKQGQWKDRIKKGMLYIHILLTYSLEEAIQTADSMRARGYGQFQRTTYEYFRWKKSDIVSIIYLVLLFSLCIYGRLFNNGLLTIYPIMEPMSLSPQEVIILCMNVLFFSLPLLAELGDVIQWRILK
ncbi:MAG TPA: energy-coupling factor transporter transmembrane component T [Pseudoneobacillus sp.]|nr:energy-coupling factor transporter transmembrane component T [Pseudoneobacillus sp.]